MDSVIVSDFDVMLGKTSERLVVRGPRPRLELIEACYPVDFKDTEDGVRRNHRVQLAAYSPGGRTTIPDEEGTERVGTTARTRHGMMPQYPGSQLR